MALLVLPLLAVGIGGCGATSGEPGKDASSGSVTAMGGSVDYLRFAVFGDVRPPNVDEDSLYPTSTLASIVSGIDKLDTEFTIATGDYMFADNESSVVAQIAQFKSATSGAAHPLFPVMGNHECNGYTSSNCPQANETPNVLHYMSDLSPFAKVPWYDFTVTTNLGSAKFLFIAANAWGPAQQNWLMGSLARQTKYTFIVRHEPPGRTDPGGAPSDSIIARFPVTLELFGHTHEYSHDTFGGVYNQVISGNAGAPLERGSGTFGYLYVVERPDGNVSVTEYVQGTDMPTDNWVVTPDGQQTT